MNEVDNDIVEEFKGATIQHGASNNRIYLMKIGDANPSELSRDLKSFAVEKGYTRIFAKIASSVACPFLDEDYIEEACIPGFYNRKEDALFLGFHLDPERSVASDREQLDKVLMLAKQRRGEGSSRRLLEEAKLRGCEEKDVHGMADIYKEVFPTYPFPIDDPEYLLDTMRSHVAYFGIETGGELVALASAEMDRTGANAELTDFATLPQWLGNGFAFHLLEHMENVIPSWGIATGYTIARAISPGMNITFAKQGYDFGGQLINNTNISGKIESMNVWYKHL